MTKDRAAAYKAAGVDIDAGASLVQKIKSLAASTGTSGVVSGIGGFGGLFRPDLTGMTEPVLVAATDGVGTKLKLAFEFDKHVTVGVDLVAMSVNDILVQGAATLFFLDYFACGKLDPRIFETVIAGVADGCRLAGCALLGGETAEMPGMYPEGEYDLAGFGVGLVDKKRATDGSETRPGDALIGIASSGVHSNGFSLVRKILAQSGLKGDSPFPGEAEKTVAEVLLAPTTIYTKAVLPLSRDVQIKAMAHITGGGFYDNIPRSLPNDLRAVVEFGSWPVPPVFQWLKEEGGLSWPEMLQIFNCGVGFVLVVPESQAEETIERINASGLGAWKIGRVATLDEKPEDAAERVEIIFNDGGELRKN